MFHKYDECPHCDISGGGQHHTQCPNYRQGEVRVLINVDRWKGCVAVYLHPQWDKWLDHAPVRLSGHFGNRA